MSEDKKNEEPDFSAFADWHVVTQKWPNMHLNEGLTEHQKNIVLKNVQLLQDRESWDRHVKAFEFELSKITDESKRTEERKRFQIHFDGHDFSSQRNNYSGYHFPCPVSFQENYFGKQVVDFSDSHFTAGPIYFNKIDSNDGEFFFTYIKIDNGSLWISNSKFSNSNIYITDVNFTDADLVLTNLDIDGSILLSKLYFKKMPLFHGLDVQKNFHINKCTFKELPDFRNSNFQRVPNVSEILIPLTKMKNQWPFQKAIDSYDVRRYRKLKSMAQDANDHIMEGYFFAQEMRAKRGVEITSFWELLLNELYYVFSNYGQSYWRPLIGLFGSFYLFSIIYKLVMFPHLKGFDGGLVALDYSLRHTLPFIGSLLRFSPRPENHQSWFLERLDDIGKQGIALEVMAYIGLFQSILGLILLFLLALGLRNAFRMK